MLILYWKIQQKSHAAMCRFIIVKKCKKKCQYFVGKVCKNEFRHFFLQIHGPIGHRCWPESCTRQVREAKKCKIIKIRQQNKTLLKMLFPCCMGSRFFFDSRRGFFSKS